jgi:hypothetical protein
LGDACDISKFKIYAGSENESFSILLDYYWMEGRKGGRERKMLKGMKK